MTYAEYVSGSDHTHWDDFYNVTYEVVNSMQTPADKSNSRKPNRPVLIASALVVLLIVGIVIFMVTSNGSDGDSDAAPDFQDAAAAARQGLDTLENLAEIQEPAALGFESKEQVASATLGEPMQVFTVALDDLRSFAAATDDPEPLLEDSDRSIFPVEVDGRARSSVLVEKSDSRFRSVSVGSPSLAQALDSTRPEGDSFVVHVQALSTYLHASRTADGIQMTPVFSDPRFEFTAGRAMAARDALGRMVEAAKAYNGLPD